ncbi:hypothetical protein [Halorhodospira halochloris]|uniref:hypothetical protein n=1 Tax=Halorhodospira halochloris TaxID=1052 RepID=UPI0013A53478|nr:hypothetical protein [Halorhodospira halochloris]
MSSEGTTLLGLSLKYWLSAADMALLESISQGQSPEKQVWLINMIINRLGIFLNWLEGGGDNRPHLLFDSACRSMSRNRHG